MKCIIPDTNAKVFARSIQFLSRVGEELFVEALKTGLTIRTINTTKSSFAIITFLPHFFIDFSEGYNEKNEEENKCKLSMKSVLSVFRNMKQIRQCTLYLDIAASKLVICLKCRLDTVRTHYVKILEHDSLQAIYTTDQFPNRLYSKYETFNDIVSSFRSNEEEITVEVNENQMIAKNYIDGVPVDPKAMKSQLTMSADEFDRFQIEEDTAITFCLREFRAFLHLAETLHLDILMNFESAGRPVVFVLKSIDTFEINLVMSTVKEDHDISSIRHHSKKNKSGKINQTKNKQNEQNGKETNDKKKRRKINLLDDNDDELFNFIPEIESGGSVDPLRNDSLCNSGQSNSSQILISELDFVPPLSPRISLLPPPTPKSSLPVPESESIVLPMSSSISKKSLINIEQSRIAVPHQTNLDSEDIQVVFQDDSEENTNKTGHKNPTENDNDINNENDSIPPSPERQELVRKRRFIFRRCFEMTFNPNTLPGASQVLAEDSDQE